MQRGTKQRIGRGASWPDAITAKRAIRPVFEEKSSNANAKNLEGFRVRMTREPSHGLREVTARFGVEVLELRLVCVDRTNLRVDRFGDVGKAVAVAAHLRVHLGARDEREHVA